jgi:hypothetical protein
MNVRNRHVRAVASGAVGLVLAAGLANGAFAQTAAPHAASVVAGTCASPGAATAKLANLSSSANPGSPAASGLSPASAPVIPVETSVTTLAMSLASLVDGTHAITINQGSATLACGNLGAQAGGDVVVGLASANRSAYSGIAWLHASGDQTQVTLFVSQNSAASGRGGEGEGGEGESEG